MQPSSSRPRPLSPHLQIYKPQLTSALSILHRITGVVLAIGAVKIAFWLWAVAYSPACAEWIRGVAGSWYGHASLFLWSAVFYYHLCNGIRHLLWDIGYGYDIPTVYRSGYAVLAATAALTALTWGTV